MPHLLAVRFASSAGRHSAWPAPTLLAAACVLLAGFDAAAEPQPAGPRTVLLLVHGMKLRVDAPQSVWGGRERGLIAALEKAGWRYGGVVRGQGGSVRLPEEAAPRGAGGSPSLFALEYSAAANVDGVAYQALEVADCVEQLRRRTGCDKVRIVAHSAGGIAVRAYVQGALPRVPFAGDVDRVVTIGTPHLGCELSEHLGDFVGPRATSLRPGSELIRRLNDELPLPAEVLFASIVVRGTNVGNTGLKWNADPYAAYVPADLLRSLPVDMRLGGDQCVQVCSQNLALAACGRKYRRTAARPVVAAVCRVDDPTPRDLGLFETTVHEVAPGDAEVMREVVRLVGDDCDAWRAVPADRLAEVAETLARRIVLSAIEDAAAEQHNLSEPAPARLATWKLVRRDGRSWTYRFSGTSVCTPRLFRFHSYTTRVEGTLTLSLDDFGGPADCRVEPERVFDE